MRLYCREFISCSLFKAGVLWLPVEVALSLFPKHLELSLHRLLIEGL